MNRLISILDILLAINLLEYHDKNFLYSGTNPGTLCEERRKLIEEAIKIAKNHEVPF